MFSFRLPFLAFFFLLVPAEAYATRTVTSPYVDADTLKLKWKGGATHDERQSRDGAWSSKLSAEYGFTPIVSVEVEGDAENPGDRNDTDYVATSIKAKAQITKKGEYPIDVGARLSYEINHLGDPDTMEFKLILAKDSATFRHVANIILDRETGNDAQNDVNGGLSWSSRYKWTPAFEPGIEIYSNFGSLSDSSDFDDQDHGIGPVVYGKLTDQIKYEVGYIAGISDNAADGRAKAVLEYAIKF